MQLNGLGSHRRSFAKFVLHEILLNGHLQCLGAAGIVLLSSLATHRKPSFWMILGVYSIFYTIYSFNRWIELDRDEIDDPERTRHLRSQKKWNLPIVAIAAILPIALAARFSATQFVTITVLYIGFGFAYSLGGKELTRHIPLFKNLYVALFYGSLPFCLSFDSGGIPPRMHLVSSIAILAFARTFGMSIILDARDIKGDRLGGLRTLPLMVGRSAAVLLANSLTATISGIVSLQCIRGTLEMTLLPIAGSALISLLPGTIAARFSTNPSTRFLWEGAGPALWSTGAALAVWSQGLA